MLVNATKFGMNFWKELVEHDFALLVDWSEMLETDSESRMEMQNGNWKDILKVN